MLKQGLDDALDEASKAATFGWLCVETALLLGLTFTAYFAATCGWLCVETAEKGQDLKDKTAATFGWLCVETGKNAKPYRQFTAATFGWLCVETEITFSKSSE